MSLYCDISKSAMSVYFEGEFYNIPREESFRFDKTIEMIDNKNMDNLRLLLNPKEIAKIFKKIDYDSGFFYINNTKLNSTQTKKMFQCILDRDKFQLLYGCISQIIASGQYHLVGVFLNLEHEKIINVGTTKKPIYYYDGVPNEMTNQYPFVFFVKHPYTNVYAEEFQKTQKFYDLLAKYKLSQAAIDCMISIMKEEMYLNFRYLYAYLLLKDAYGEKKVLNFLKNSFYLRYNYTPNLGVNLDEKTLQQIKTFLNDYKGIDIKTINSAEAFRSLAIVAHYYRETKDIDIIQDVISRTKETRILKFFNKFVPIAADVEGFKEHQRSFYWTQQRGAQALSKRYLIGKYRFYLPESTGDYLTWSSQMNNCISRKYKEQVLAERMYPIALLNEKGEMFINAMVVVSIDGKISIGEILGVENSQVPPEIKNLIYRYLKYFFSQPN